MSRRPLIIAHRGDSAHAPENTLAAFRAAIQAGADGVEFDVRLSRDGVPVVIHDQTLRRTASRPEFVHDLTAKELGEVDVGSWFNAKKPRAARPEFARETVPALIDALPLYAEGDGLVYIEIKCGRGDIESLTEAVCGLVESSPALPRVIMESFNLAAITMVRRLLPAMQTAALFEPKASNVLWSRKRIVLAAREAGAHQLSLHRLLLTPALAVEAQEAEMPVTIWTTDRPGWVSRASRLGVRALITNHPAKLLAARDDR